jgi:hypothetical protein
MAEVTDHVEQVTGHAATSLTPCCADDAVRGRAVNLDPQADNRIHDDDVAQRFGFAGALVQGVEVLRAGDGPPAGRGSGRGFLAGGRLDLRLPPARCTTASGWSRPAQGRRPWPSPAPTAGSGRAARTRAAEPEPVGPYEDVPLPDALLPGPAAQGRSGPSGCRRTRRVRRLRAADRRAVAALRRAGPPRPAAAAGQPGAHEQRRARPLDPHRQRLPPPVARAHRRAGGGAQPGDRAPAAERARLRAVRRARRGGRAARSPEVHHEAIWRLAGS